MSYRGFCYLLRVFTALPLLPYREAGEEQKGKSLVLLPLWAAVLSTACGFLAYGLSFVGAPVAAACSVGLDFALTGGRRALGVQKVSASLAAGRTKQEKIAAAWYGTAATPAGWAGLALVLFVKYLFYMQIISKGGALIYLPAAIFYAYALWPILFMTCPLRRNLAEAEPFRRYYKKNHLYISSFFSFMILAFILRQMVLLCPVILLLLWLLSRRWSELLGGLASAELFAACEWAEIFFLALIILYLTIF